MSLARGIDISSAQTVTDWAAVAKALDFVIVKATEGTTFTSRTWSHYYQAAKAAKVLRGSYHFAHPGNNPVTEARHYTQALQAAGFRSGFDLPPALDIEATEGKSKAALTAWCLTFLHEVDTTFHLTKPWQKTGVYLNGYYSTTCLDGPVVVDGRWKWLAAWPIRNGAWPADATRPAGAAVWQFTDRLHVPGVREGVDGDVARLEDLHSLAPEFYGTHPIPVPVPVPVPPHPHPPALPVISRRLVARNKTQVLLLQAALNAATGSNVHGGYHDPATITAIRAWQKKLHEKQSGWLTQAELEALARATKRFTAHD